MPIPTRWGLVAIAITFLATATAYAQSAAFTNVTPAIMFDDGWGEGASWVDYDQDGDLDLLVSNEGGYLRLYRNDGGSFALATPPGLSAGGTWTGISWGDYDNDGDLDLLAIEAERPKHLFRNDGGNNFVEVPVPVLADSAHAHAVSWVDFDRDGDLDFFNSWAPSTQNPNRSGADRLVRNDGNGVFTDVTPPVLQDPQYGTGNSWADFDNDGDPDLCVANNGFAHVYRNDGGGAFTDVTPIAMGSYGHAGGIAWGDYDNDGDFDLFIARAYGARCLMLRNVGGAFIDATTPAIAPPGDCYEAQAADYDNDGDLDLFVGDINGPNYLYRNDGGFTFVNVANAALADSSNDLGASWGDYDGDGDLDLYLANDYGTRDALWRNDLANGNHWLELDLIGVQSNRSAIDAQVRVVTGSLRQLRRVDGGSGYNSQNGLRLHFGLGTATVADTIHIRWPSGILQDTALVASNQVLRIRERSTRLAVESDPRGREAITLSSAPNPFRADLAVEFELPRPETAELRVADTQGRLVRALSPRARREAGRHRASWDGRDDAGRAAPPGIYFVRLTTPGLDRSIRVVRLGE